MAQRCAIRIAMKKLRPATASSSAINSSHTSSSSSYWRLSSSLIQVDSNPHASSRTNTSTPLRYASLNNYQPCRNSSFQTTPKLCQEEKSSSSSSSTEKDEEKLPDYANPILHNDPNKQKVMLSDYKEGEEIPMAQLPPIDDGSGSIPAAPHLHELADEIINLKIMEVKELVDKVAEHFGIEDDVDAFGFGGGTGGGGGEEGGEGGAAAEEEKVEKTAFDLKLVAFDAKAKIKIIKEIRGMTSLGLKEAKELVEGAPKTVLKDIKMEEATEFKEKLEALGATVEIE